VEKTDVSMKVFTFYQPVDGKDAAAEEDLIALWSRSWELRGWTPVVLGQSSIPDTLENRRIVSELKTLPSQNKKHLDLWCYLRWLAVAEQGGGVMSDYDVINYDFQPFEVGALTTWDRWIPCLVSGTRDEFLRVVNWFRAERRPWWSRLRAGHTSDMLILQAHQADLVMRRDCVEYDLHGWETAKAVHFSNRGMKAAGRMPRHVCIPQMRSLSE
jgi:hypothetical protein